MSVTGLCDICESAEAEFTCSQCSAAVCELHYEKTEGLCSDCAVGQQKPEEREESHGREGTRR